MIEFKDGEIASLLGPNYRSDPEVAALSYAIKQGMQVLLDHAKRGHIYAGVDDLDANVLDMLAAENIVNPVYSLMGPKFDPQFSDEDYRKAKAKLIKDSFAFASKTGTVYAIQKAVNETPYGSRYYWQLYITEWYLYGGEPYHFKASLTSGSNFIDKEKALELIQKTVLAGKNVSSVFDGVISQFVGRIDMSDHILVKSIRRNVIDVDCTLEE